MIKEFFAGLNRFVVQWQLSRNWFEKQKPERIATGLTDKNGIYPEEQSEADKERAGIKEPHNPKPCAWKSEHGYCNCARMLKEK